MLPALRRVWGVPLLVFGLVLLAVVLWLGARGMAAAQHLDGARADLVAARGALLDRDLSEADRAVEAAGRQTSRARALTSDPVWRLAGALPVVGDTPAAVAALAAAADDLAQEVLPPALDAAAGIDPAALRTPDGTIDLAVLRTAAPDMTASSAEAARVVEDLSALAERRPAGVVARAGSELHTQAQELAGTLADAEQVLRLVPVLLGEDQPRRYLVLVQQPGEARGTGGLIGGYLALEASQGRLQSLDEGSNAGLRNGAIPVPPGVPEDFQLLYGSAGAFRLWQNANLSPDVPVVARVLAARWAAQGGGPLDGVVLLDGVALGMLLQGSGPVPVAGGEVAPEDLAEYLAVGQYRDFSALDRVQERKDELDDVAAVVAERLVSGGGDTEALLRGLVEAVRSGHVRMASDDPVLGPQLAAAGIDGALPESGPLVYPVVNNATGGKLDHFLDRKVTWTAGDCTGERRRSTVRIELGNGVPAGDLPPYLTLRLAGGQLTFTRDLSLVLSVYATQGADLVRATVDGAALAPENPDGLLLTEGEEAGLPRYSVQVDVPDGGTTVLELELDEPVVAGEPRVLEQPLSRPQVAEVAVPACADAE